MRVRYNKNAEDNLRGYVRYLDTKEDIQRVLKSNLGKKIYVEIGMGKGEFISNMAARDPENIYIGVEVCKSVLALAVKKILRFEKDNNLQLSNLYLMSFDAKDLIEIFDDAQIEKIFLNFSDPWPKKKHTKRRLTYTNFLEQYKKVLREDGIIEFKTDNRELFEYSLVSMQNFGMTFLEVFLDLHKTNTPNIVTEYEEKFSKYGPIYKLIAKI